MMHSSTIPISNGTRQLGYNSLVADASLGYVNTLLQKWKNVTYPHGKKVYKLPKYPILYHVFCMHEAQFWLRHASDHLQLHHP